MVSCFKDNECFIFISRKAASNWLQIAGFFSWATASLFLLPISCCSSLWPTVSCSMLEVISVSVTQRRHKFLNWDLTDAEMHWAVRDQSISLRLPVKNWKFKDLHKLWMTCALHLSVDTKVKFNSLSLQLGHQTKGDFFVDNPKSPDGQSILKLCKVAQAQTGNMTTMLLVKLYPLKFSLSQNTTV